MEINTIPVPLEHQPVVSKKSRTWLIMFAVAVLFLVIGVICGYLYGINGQLYTDDFTSKKWSLPSTRPLGTPLPSEDTNTTTMPEKTFVSSKLGIRFEYVTLTDSYYRWPVAASESGSTVTLWVTHPEQEPEPSQYVEVFDKDPNDDLQTAIKKTVLKGYSAIDCFVTTSKDALNFDQPTNPAISYAEIKVTTDENADLDVLFEKAKKCPAEYVALNYVAYFYYDANHPDKFLFFSLGQEAGTYLQNGKLWFQTVQFLK